MLIRPATPADVPKVLPMVAKICALHDAWDSAKYGFLPHPEQRYQNWLGKLTNSDSSAFLVAEDEENLVGFLVATVEREIPIYRLKEFAFIHDIWVEPDYRQRGVARQMVILAVEIFQKMDIHQIRLDTAAINEAARRLFASCGFRISTIEMLMELSQ
ncbi:MULTISPECIES: GNAT family N-acetyltransferase [unclassified Tolypothrix]|uniref:GNAT family N-acetyltransferase n=1 Tax=unclassified Tolypothrix TaxID=2649714 RepID=UPI0005EAC128|nr:MULTISPECIES: GNAT family N-acetyltransferase [unclassified Tolypothrix]BAY88385.1 acetyltransferase, GNAT family protein [Microchaete diplosiphon NIES-3275]EKF02241.1 acetyltransferase, GNAT family [Tolypothrix sp. PCC 7601]MBE9081200.1 GNAT family N-acetyltransferase [Tolypothrix sp. LEGE 11397]UYD29069.1 GNAT family N-acetyltransferase [Tolypothrix sp. PCC 7712]UYD35017.1 GNAT family N-acetyltransferase [Tolypothrix sp. PCC 7601]